MDELLSALIVRIGREQFGLRFVTSLAVRSALLVVPPSRPRRYLKYVQKLVREVGSANENFLLRLLNLHSLQVLDQLTRAATSGELSWSDIESDVNSLSRVKTYSTPMILEVARISCLMNLSHHYLDISAKIYNFVIAESGLEVLDTPPMDKIPGHRVVCSKLTTLAKTQSISPVADFVAETDALYMEEIPFTENGFVVPIQRDLASPNFDGWIAPAVENVDGPLVTVVMTSYHPDRAIFTAVDSLLSQSWKNLEIIIVDDGSPMKFDEILQQVAALDKRIRIVLKETNDGTYVTKNLGLAQAQGEFVTFLDSDDWAHPQRVQAQVEQMLADASIHANVTMSLRMNEALALTTASSSLFADPMRWNRSSLMIRHQRVITDLGFFDSVRKSADSELYFRLTSKYGKPPAVLLSEVPLTYVRLADGTLTSTDFQHEWMHPGRTAYAKAARRWYTKQALTDASLYVAQNARPFPAPANFLPTRPSQELDVLFIGDQSTPKWRPEQLENVNFDEYLQSGARVGVLHLPSLIPVASGRRQKAVMDLIDDGKIVDVQWDEVVAAKEIVIVTPESLMFPPVIKCKVSANTVEVYGRPAREKLGALEGGYGRDEVSATIRQIFSVEPEWAVQAQG